MARKLFIVAAGNEQLFRSLRNALANEGDVDVIFDRRKRDQPAWRPPEDRRVSSDVQERICTAGFAVVRLSDSQARSDDNIRW